MTANMRNFEPLLSYWASEERSHAGVILIPPSVSNEAFRTLISDALVEQQGGARVPEVRVAELFVCRRATQARAQSPEMGRAYLVSLASDTDERALLTPQSPPRSEAYCNRTATGLIRTATQWTKRHPWIVENCLNKRYFRTHQDRLGRSQANS
jgi:hypothetical protein